MQTPIPGRSPRTAPLRPVRLGPARTLVTPLADGGMLLRSPQALGAYPQRLTEKLIHWAEHRPQQAFLAWRPHSHAAWETLNYAEAWRRVRAIAQALLDRGLSAAHPIAIVSENGVEHALIALAAMHVGIPYAPISPAYSLVSTDFGKLRHSFELLTPRLIFAGDGDKYGRALKAAAPPEAEIVVAEKPPAGLAVTLFDALEATTATAAVEAAHAATDADSIAKFLFTSGSTGMPKAVINTQRMICANQQMIAQSFPLLEDEPPVIVDWLPWHHTFGGNHNLGMMLFHGGTLYLDDGKPVPGAIELTVRNLREIAPTIYFNVPKGFEGLIPYFRREPALREKFFSRLSMMMYAGAGLPQKIWDELDELAVQTCGQRILMTTGLGCTESAPSALFANWDGGWSGLLGLPVPGLELKLVPVDGKLEARYRGPSITPGYWRQEAMTRAAFDEEGYYRTGDALRCVDPADVDRGLLFDGRIAEDFKLTTGTWVSVGSLRAALVGIGTPYLQDAVITGHDRDFIGAILFPNLESCRTLAPDLTASADGAAVIAHPAVRGHFERLLASLAAHSTGSSSRILRAVLTAVPASIDAGEITDKGSLNQRAVLRERAELVEELYRGDSSPRVLHINEKGLI